MITACIGLSWGDEGKGKISDLLASENDYIVRYSGGANAGHTIVVEGQKYKFHHLPCGSFAKNKPTLVLSNGMVINPITLSEEIRSLPSSETTINISEKAHCVMPWHIASDTKKGSKIGTTGKGIGPCYADKMHRSYAIRAGNLLEALKEEKTKRFFASDAALHGEGLWKQYYEAAQYLDKHLWDTGKLLRNAIKNKRNILFEGAQGIQLDIDHSSCFPFCTSSGVGPAAIPQACGLPNLHLDRIIGVTKCYWTRVGHGPFRTEMNQQEMDFNPKYTNEIYNSKLEKTLGDEIRKLGNEFGTTTGRPRRIGWMDMPILKESLELSGATEIALMHCDTITKFNNLIYIFDGKNYIEFNPWGSAAQNNFQIFKRYIEENTGLPVTITSWGPDREETIFHA